MAKRTKIEVKNKANVMLTSGKRIVLDKGVITYADILQTGDFGAFANVTDKEVNYVGEEEVKEVEAKEVKAKETRKTKAE